MTNATKIVRSGDGQTLLMPKELEFSDDVRDVVILRKGRSRIIVPAGHVWDDFFSGSVVEDFMEPRDQPATQSREKR